jgi:hypothetical protein
LVTEEKSAIHEQSADEVLQKSTAELLIWQGKQEAARLLLNSALEIRTLSDGWGNLSTVVCLGGPPAIFAVLSNTFALNPSEDEALKEAIWSALNWALGPDRQLDDIWAELVCDDPYPGWRDSYLAQLDGTETPLNQAVVASTAPAFQSMGLGFRSKTEVKVNGALSRTNVLFFPLPAAVVGNKRKEPDFLVCHGGRWGILEIHGDQYHTGETAAAEHDRARFFKRHGIKVFEIYEWQRCWDDPDGVVAEFLALLESHG